MLILIKLKSRCCWVIVNHDQKLWSMALVTNRKDIKPPRKLPAAKFVLNLAGTQINMFRVVDGTLLAYTYDFEVELKQLSHLFEKQKSVILNDVLNKVL